MLTLTVILLVIVADRIDAACSMPARKLAGAAMAAASKIRLMVNPLLDVSATTEPVPPLPEPLTAAMACTDSSGRMGATGAGAADAVLAPVGLTTGWLLRGSTKKEPRLASLSKSPFRSCGSKTGRDLTAWSLVVKAAGRFLATNAWRIHRHNASFAVNLRFQIRNKSSSRMVNRTGIFATPAPPQGHFPDPSRPACH